MYIGEYAPPELRNQAQGLAILLTSGLGLFASNVVMHPIMAASADAAGRHAWTVPFIVAFLAAAVLTVFAALFFRPAGASAEALRCNRE
jgi:MFS family permease